MFNITLLMICYLHYDMYPDTNVIQFYTYILAKQVVYLPS